jgi:hypothetical protein
MEALVGKNFYSRLKYAVIFIIGFFFIADDFPPANARILNECSFMYAHLSVTYQREANGVKRNLESGH